MNYTAQDIQNQIKPLSQNGFVAFFQKIWRWWLSVWYSFSDKHPKLANIIYKVFFFIVFSEGVTIWQFLLMLFLPYAFRGLAGTEFIWPQIALWDWGDGTKMIFGIFNEPLKYESDGVTLSVFGGLGNFIAFEIAVFTAQCINFPLQRNITFRSHGNPWYQAMWYFIGWVLISIFVNAAWGFVNPLVTHWKWPDAINVLLKTFITGGLSMFVFFFIFLVIFPDNEKRAKNALKKLEYMKASKASAEDIAEQEQKVKELSYAALLTKTEKDEIQASTLANSKAIKYVTLSSKQPKAKKGQSEEEAKAEHDARVEKAFNEACEALAVKEAAIKARQDALAIAQ